MGGKAELLELRSQLADVDSVLVDTLARRMELIRQVADLKKDHGLPCFDRDREGAHIDDLINAGRSHGLSDDLVRDVFGRLFAASRLEQRRAQQSVLEHYSIGIIGGTQGMGAFLARVFAQAGFPVETMGLESGPPAEQVAAQNDLVIVAVPIAATLEVIHRVGGCVRPGACLMDVTSLKRAPLAAMLDSVREDVDVVGTHPMFGPQGVDFDRQKVVLCRGRGEAGFQRVKRLFESFGAETVEATPEEHDAQMALIQVLVHEKTMVLGSVLQRVNADLQRSLELASPIYKTELAMIGRMFSQQAELYADILTANPEAAKMSHVFEQEAAHFARAVSMGDRDALIARFGQIAESMTGFAQWAKKQSDAILDDLIKHG